MFSKKWVVGIALASASAVPLLPVSYAQSRLATSIAGDDVFLSLRDAVRREDATSAGELAAQLSDYSIPSYVDYYRLKPRMKNAPVAEIRDYLARYDGSAIADRLRNDWLLELGRMRDWNTFDEQYPLFVLDDDTQLKCYALMSRASKGQNVAQEARVLLVSPKHYGEACQALIAALAERGQFSIGDLWSQIRLAAEYNVPEIVRSTARLTDAPENLVMQALDTPALVLARGPGSGRAAHEAFLIALGRLARSNPAQAISTLERAARQLSRQEETLGWAQIALQSTLKLAPDAIDLWHKANDAPLTLEGHQWKVRAGLRAGDWKLVKTAIDAMPPALRSDSTWIYWLGRALRELGKQEEAQHLFQSIASHNGFYGQLSLEELGHKISIPQQSVPPAPEEIAAAAANQGLRRALKFFELNLRFEGTREWNWQLRRMGDRQLLAAAEFARQNNVLDRMVQTSDRTKAEFDFTQRFPTPFGEIMHAHTQTLGLDKAWVYGLIRQESRFIQDARSHVGASGLMQLMPATARYVARKIGMNDFRPGHVNNINVNIALGSNYLNMVLNDLDGSQAMASAAYNAGPGRPRAWRSTLTRPVEGAIFAESIPFSETRGYVKNVLSNATYYAALFENKPQSLKARLGTISPKGFVPSELP
ncbi:MAG: lytic transglycosylase [Burkholderiales bacterium RIFCSPLOWO2_02_FULL_57_36]|nr:MAG: lytic transglycosylase [Burkholderiales bacterium RIFCSPLOWO2_02_FULL_57_36]